MKILLTISGLQFQKDEGAKKRLIQFIDSYRKLDYNVTVLLFFSIRSFHYVFGKRHYLDQNVKWVLIPVLPVSFNKIIAKLNLIINQIFLSIIARINKYDIIQSEVLGVVGKYIPAKALFIVDFHGDSVSETIFRNNNKETWLSSLLLKWQIQSLRYADFIIVVSQELKNQLDKVSGINIENYSIISCSVDHVRFKNSKMAIFNKNLSEKIVLGYCGGLQSWQNIDKIIDIACRLQNINKDYYFILFTNDDTERINHSMNKLGCQNYYIASLTFDQIPSHLKILDAGFLLRENLILNIVSSPTKLLEYLGSGVPVICTRFSGDYKKSIEHEVSGFVLSDVNPSDNEIRKLNSYLLKVKQNRDKYRSICFNSAENRSWDVEFAEHLNMINKQINANK